MPKGDPITLAEVAVLVNKKNKCYHLSGPPLCHPLQIDHTSTKIVLDENNFALMFIVLCLQMQKLLLKWKLSWV